MSFFNLPPAILVDAKAFSRLDGAVTRIAGADLTHELALAPTHCCSAARSRVIKGSDCAQCVGHRVGICELVFNREGEPHLRHSALRFGESRESAQADVIGMGRAFISFSVDAV